MSTDMFPELQALSTKLLARPIPATPPSVRPRVYGYVRSTRPGAAYIAACSDVVARWCQHEDLELGAVFRDHGVGSTALVRPAFTGLLDVLRLPDSAYALVIGYKHLSGTAPIAKRLISEIRRTGSTLRVLADELAEVRA